MAKIEDDKDGIWKQLFVDEEDIKALRRVISLAVPSREYAYDDATAIKTVAALIETAEVAHQQTLDAIQRFIDANNKGT